MKTRAEKGEELFANPRNAAAGSLTSTRSKNCCKSEIYPCLFMGWVETVKHMNIDNHSEALSIYECTRFTDK